MATEASDERFYLEEVPDDDLLQEIETRLTERKANIKRTEEILRVSARIAFGDYSDLPRLKLLFEDAGVHGSSEAQLAPLLLDE